MEDDLSPGIPSSVSYVVASWFDLPLTAIALVLTVIAIARTRDKGLTWLLLALACLAIKEAIYFVPVLTDIDPMKYPLLDSTQVWIGAAGWALLVVFTGTMAFRRASARDNFERAEA